MSVGLEWLEGKTGIIRCGEEFEKHGDPYDFVVMIELKDGIAELKGAVGHITTKGRREIGRLLKQSGIDKVQWERKNKPKDKKIEKCT